MKTPEERAREEYYTRKDIMIVLKVTREAALWATGKKLKDILEAQKSGATPAK